MIIGSMRVCVFLCFQIGNYNCVSTDGTKPRQGREPVHWLEHLQTQPIKTTYRIW